MATRTPSEAVEEIQDCARRDARRSMLAADPGRQARLGECAESTLPALGRGGSTSLLALALAADEVSDDPNVVLDRAEIDKHVAVLEKFEQRLGEYIVADHNRRVEGRSDWSSREWAERTRELRELAPRADAAIDASGVGGLAVYWPPALGGHLKADDLASLLFEVRPSGFGVEEPDHEGRQAILERLPTQIEGLKMRREEAAEPKRKKRRAESPGWFHEPNPWALVIVGGVAAAVIAALIIALIL
jgi:hypothetical protein